MIVRCKWQFGFHIKVEDIRGGVLHSGTAIEMGNYTLQKLMWKLRLTCSVVSRRNFHIPLERTQGVSARDAVRGVSNPNSQQEFRHAFVPQVIDAIPAEPVEPTFLAPHLLQYFMQTPPQDVGARKRGASRTLKEKTRSSLADTPICSRSSEANEERRSASRAPASAKPCRRVSSGL